jgi:hypothetical protein
MTGESRDILEASGGNILTLSAEEALKAAAIIDDLLRETPDGARVLLDGSTTSEPDSGGFFASPIGCT